MTLFLVEYSGLCEIEAESALDAEARFEEMGNALMECGTVAYHFPLTEDEYARRADTPAPVRVKDLVWRDSYGVQRAETMFGDYLVTGIILTLPTALRPQMVLDTPEAAKAAAQADYTARILAALEPAPDALADPRVVALYKATKGADT